MKEEIETTEDAIQVIKQITELACKNGLLTLRDAYLATMSIRMIEKLNINKNE